VEQKDLTHALQQLAGTEVVIVGDVMLDEYIFGTVERISPEAPVPVVRVDKEEYRLGGAGNVAKNIVALGGKAKLFGFLGQDAAAKRLENMFQEQGIENCCVRECDKPTTRKTRVIAQQQQIVRVDRERVCAATSNNTSPILSELAQRIKTSPVVIISDYGKGLINVAFMEQLRRICRSLNHKPIIIVDPKPKNYAAYTGVDMLTPNTKEAGIEHPGMDGTSSDAGRLDALVVQSGKKLMAQLQCNKLLITLGARGMMLFESKNEVVHIPTAARKVYDVTGAGDTVIAVLGLALAAGLSTLTGCLMANYAAGIVVGQVGATAVSREQLREAILTWPQLKVNQIAQ
jgi:D-glycero-beta-D-manno-heptose-7-phosphate kinase